MWLAPSIDFFARRMRVCVTGGAGFIGSWLVSRLLTLGHQVVVLDDLSSGTRAPPPAPGLRFVQGSVLDPHAIDDATRGADVLIHLAGVVGMRLAKAERQRAVEVSVAGTELLLARTPPLPAILLSSSAVYGLNCVAAAQESMGGSEDRGVEYDGGVAGYATGKCRMEELGRRAGRPVLCVRPFNVVGPGQLSTWGMVLPSFIERARAGRELIVFGDGRQTRCFSFVGTFVEALLQAVSNPAGLCLPDRALNIGATQATSILDLARLVVARVKSDSAIVHAPYSSVFPDSRDVVARIPDTARLTSLIGTIEWPSIAKIVDSLIEGNHSLSRRTCSFSEPVWRACRRRRV